MVWNAWKSVKSWDVKYAEYLAQSRQRNQSCDRRLQRSPQGNGLANPASNRRSPDLQTRNVPLYQPFGNWIYYLPSHSRRCPERYTCGRNAARLLKSTIQADYWLTSNRVADKVTKFHMIDSGVKTIRRLYWKLNSKEKANGLSSCHSEFVVSDLEKSRHFYCDLLIFCRIRCPEEKFSSFLEDCQLMKKAAQKN